jgi:putative transposase
VLIKRAFKFRLTPTQRQTQIFQRFAGARRWIFNRGLEQRQKMYQETGKTVSYFAQNNELPSLKEQPETSWLKEIHSQVLQQALKDLNLAYQHFFRRIRNKETPGHPKFKKKGAGETFRYPQGVQIQDSTVFLPKIGWVKFRKSRDIQGTLNETTITQEGNHWTISFSCEWEKSSPPPVPLHEERAIGIDLGITTFAVTASGIDNKQQDIENPRILTKLLPRLRLLSRRLSQKVKKSKNCFKARLKLSKLHARIKNTRNNFAQQLSAQIVKTHDIFCIESLDISNLLKIGTPGLSRAIADVGWRQFLHCLKYKAEEKGKYIVEAGKYFPSTQTCSRCGYRQKMALSTREYHCPSCGLKIGRDYNSAIDLKAAGMSVLKSLWSCPNRGTLKQESLAL